MKIEIRKETKWDGTVAYWTYIDHVFDKCFFSLEDAEKRYEAIMMNARNPTKVEVIKTEVI
jgi:hypothetical protein